MHSDPTTSISASGADAITRPLDIRDADLSSAATDFDFDVFYDIERTSRELVDGGYQRIALQFPDELLHDSVPVFRKLTKRISELKTSRAQDATASIKTSGSVMTVDSSTERLSMPELYVLADTSYGSCCVDEVAAQHVSADVLVHYGHACLTLTSRLPVIYVFGCKPLDAKACAVELVRAYSDNKKAEAERKKVIVLKHDVAYNHLADKLLDAVRDELSAVEITADLLYEKIGTSARPAPGSLTAPHNPVAQEDGVQADDTSIFYVGGENLGLTNLLMTNSGLEVYTYDPRLGTAVLASVRTNRLLMRRYVAVQKARDSDVVGILVGTLGVASYLPLISYLRALLSKQRKKSYTISVGKLNPAKLANFLEIECFVMVACPENSIVEDKEFLRPIVTPYELEVALQDEMSWTGRYILDFGKLLAEAGVSNSTPFQSAPLSDTELKNADTIEVESQKDGPYGPESDDDQPQFSLLSGTYRHARRYGPGLNGDGRGISGGNGTGGELILRNQDDSIVLAESAAGAFLQRRTYRGLDPRTGENAPGVLEQGRSGIARGYQDDRQHQDIV